MTTARTSVGGRITLYRASGADGTSLGWYADHHGDAGIMDLFGTDQLPTAFVGRANWRVVEREIQRLYPDVEVGVDILSRQY